MKKGLIIFILIIILFLLLTLLVFNNKDKTVWLSDNEYLYNKAVEYIINENTNNSYDKDKEDYKVFTDFQGFGIEKNDKFKYVYMWILEESYYVEDNKLKSSSGSSMMYKFEFNDDEVVRYILPKDGDDYSSSLKNMLPDSIENIVLDFNMNDGKLKSKVKEHYSYLPSVEINV